MNICLHESREPVLAPKLERRNTGPFLKSKDLISHVCIAVGRSGSDRVVNHDKLKLYEGDNPPKWIKASRKKLPAV